MQSSMDDLFMIYVIYVLQCNSTLAESSGEIISGKAIEEMVGAFQEI